MLLLHPVLLSDSKSMCSAISVVLTYSVWIWPVPLPASKPRVRTLLQRPPIVLPPHPLPPLFHVVKDDGINANSSLGDE